MTSPASQPPPPPPPPEAAAAAVDRRRSKRTYSRDFLLSFSGLDTCKRLPDGVDKAALSELQDDSGGGFEWQRVHGVRRNESGPQRGGAGRWETQSSGSSDKDGEQQLDAQDSGRRVGNQSWRSWQHTEHDGLLGRGAFPRPSSGHLGASAPKSQANSNIQINKSTEPYQLPRSYKAAPYSRKDGTDSFNDETFGSAECSNEDRVEEERKRRASFELMRKQQHKAIQEKQIQIPASGKPDTDINALLESFKDKNIQNDSFKTCYTQAPLSRPLVPPGFANAVTEKNICAVSSSTAVAPEAGSTSGENDLTLNGADHVKESRNHSAASVDISIQKNDLKSTFHSVDESETSTTPPGGIGIMHSVGITNPSFEALGLPDATEFRKDVVNGLSNKESRTEDINTVGHNHSTSILEKFFGSSLPSSSSNFVEYPDIKTVEEEPDLSVSSKFARWFIEDEKTPVEDSSSRDLLSLITSNGTAGSQPVTSINKVIEQNPLSIPSGFEDPVAELFQLAATSSVLGTREQYRAAEKPSSSSGILTCQDLEQSMMAQVNEGSSSLQHSLKGTRLDAKSPERKAEVDKPGSQLLLSLLQPGGKELPSMTGLSGKFSSTDGSMVRNSDTVDISEKTPTLGELFGPSFMNQLQSVEAPLSVKRDLAGETISMDVPFHGSTLPHTEDNFLSSSSVEYQTSQRVHEGNFLASRKTQEGNILNTPPPQLRYGDTGDISKLGDIGFDEGASDVRLPEESIFSDSSLFENVNTEFVPEKAVELLNGRPRNAMVRGGAHPNIHDLGGPLALSHYDMANSDSMYNHFSGRQPLQIPRQMNQGYRDLRNPAMNIMGADNSHFDPHNPFPTNLPRHAFNITGEPGFDPVAHHQMLQHMPRPPNFPPHHPVQGLSRGLPQPRHINHMPGYMPEMNNVHGYPPLNRQPNFGGPRMGIAGVHGEPHPEVFERFMEMRAKSNQIHRSGGHFPGNYNPEFDRNFRYR